MNHLRTIIAIGVLINAAYIVRAQTVPVVAKVTFISIDNGKVDLDPIEIYNGFLANWQGVSVSNFPKNSSFGPGEWLVTIKYQESRWVLVSAYQLNVQNQALRTAPQPLYQRPTADKTSRSAMPPGITYEERIAELVNEERWNNGMLPPMKHVSLLQDLARAHSEDMAISDFFGHCNLNNVDFDARMVNGGYFWASASENIAAGRSTPEGTMDQWMSSGGHRANVLSTSRNEIGVGYYYQSNDQSGIIDRNGCSNAGLINFGLRHYWTQKYGRRSNNYPVVINREAHITTQASVNLYVYGAGFAAEMRFRNESGNWSNWESYTPDKVWTLSSGSGDKTVYAEIRNSSGVVRSYSDNIYFDSPEIVCPNPMIISDQVLSGVQTLTDCEIIADPNVDMNGNIIFNASKVGLGADVNIMAGSEFTVNIEQQ